MLLLTSPDLSSSSLIGADVAETAMVGALIDPDADSSAARRLL
jgi:hypothetical protein